MTVDDLVVVDLDLDDLDDLVDDFDVVDLDDDDLVDDLDLDDLEENDLDILRADLDITVSGFLYMSKFLHQWLTATQYIAPLMANFDTRLGGDSNIHYVDNG